MLLLIRRGLCVRKAGPLQKKTPSAHEVGAGARINQLASLTRYRSEAAQTGMDTGCSSDDECEDAHVNNAREHFECCESAD